MKDAHPHSLGPILRWLATLACLCFGMTATASNLLVLQQNQGKYLPGSYVEFFVDQNKNHDIQTIIEQQSQIRWQKSSENFPNFGFGDFAVWAHLQIQSQLDHTGVWYLVNRYPLLDKMETYVFANGQLLDHMTVGDAQPFKERKVLHPELIFPVELEPNVRYDIFLRIESTGTLQFILELTEPKFYWQHDHSSAALMG
ncbi:MAG TPA: 7TM-DISM domain-containing protein, partial [Pseudomonadales bacterium]|nr:7TM-DISM domain-containing protein [Pseudomonadales bacterium]